MAEGDNRAQYTDVANINKELPVDTVKADPTAMNRLPEDTARANAYAAAGEKDVLPEHKARRDRYQHITAASA